VGGERIKENRVLRVSSPSNDQPRRLAIYHLGAIATLDPLIPDPNECHKILSGVEGADGKDHHLARGCSCTRCSTRCSTREERIGWRDRMNRSCCFLTHLTSYFIRDSKEEIGSANERLHISSSSKALRISEPLWICCWEKVVHQECNSEFMTFSKRAHCARHPRRDPWRPKDKEPVAS
jgi:hypothetical protein